MKRTKTTRVLLLVAVVACIAMMLSVGCFAVEEGESFAYNTLWAALPPVIAIGLALITKEVHSSLFLGILVGAMMYANFDFMGTFVHVFEDGIIANLSDSYNVGILIFLVILGTMVQLMNAAGGSAAFGKWSTEHIKSRTAAQLAVVCLGVLIFIDDYFNCLTVGSVMRPLSDKHKISRAKLAYLIDATAAPVCIIAPVSSWAAAVTGFVDGVDGLDLFISAIPYNYYALLTILMMVAMAVMKVEFGPMAVHEHNAIEKGDIYTTPDRPYENATNTVPSSKGKVLDLIFPILVLIVMCVIGLIYSGGFFDGGVGFAEAFSNADASIGLTYGSFFAFVITIVWYVIRRVLTFRQMMDLIPEGFKAMVPAILILTFAWTLKTMTDSLGLKHYIADIVLGFSDGMMSMLPAVIFVIGCIMSFATGTSWGTFGVLIPIVVAAYTEPGVGFTPGYESIGTILVSACMAGAVCGDHCSPISDTTIMASAGAQCNHLNHVQTQLPYALSCAAISFVAYIFAGFIQNAVICLLIAIAMMIGFLFVMKILHKNEKIGKVKAKA
ncbi:MAG: Na+/H+ antiporter NhaC family protein [Clostridia bacterium]|nr:Na+/H+ antiporter NhaC family protein [Clostridia bacterium]MDY2929686.1 Na+/H+ antiporter NhaC family protein [Clostridiaceae bacterium]